MSRLEAVARSLSKRFDVDLLEPFTTTRRFGTVLSSAIRYSTYCLVEAIAKTDILHIFNAPDFIHVPSLLKRVKLCYDYRSNYSEKLRYSYPRVAPFAKLVETALARRADVVTTVNQILAERLSKTSNSPIFVVPNYPAKTFRPKQARTKTRKLLGLEERSMALFAGSLTFTYDFDLLFASASKLPEVSFIIAGEGPNRIKLEQRAPANVRFLGGLPRSEMPDIIEASDVCLVPIRSYAVPTVHNDQDVWKITEAAALRKPIVASGVRPSSQYYLASSPEDFVRGITLALGGEISPPEPRFWEDFSEPALLDAYETLE